MNFRARTGCPQIVGGLPSNHSVLEPPLAGAPDPQRVHGALVAGALLLPNLGPPPPGPKHLKKNEN